MVPVFDMLRTAQKNRVAASHRTAPNHHATYVQGDLLIEQTDDVEPFGQMMRI